MTKNEENFQKNFDQLPPRSEKFFHHLEEICEGLIYISEIDSPVTVFIGLPEHSDDRLDMAEQIGFGPGDPVREVDFDTFFDRLTSPKEWHGEREIARTKKFLDLRKLIEENLTEPRVFKIGRPHVRIVAGGLDRDGRAVGVTMRALET